MQVLQKGLHISQLVQFILTLTMEKYGFFYSLTLLGWRTIVHVAYKVQTSVKSYVIYNKIMLVLYYLGEDYANHGKKYASAISCTSSFCRSVSQL